MQARFSSTVDSPHFICFFLSFPRRSYAGAARRSYVELISLSLCFCLSICLSLLRVVAFEKIMGEKKRGVGVPERTSRPGLWGVRKLEKGKEGLDENPSE